MNLPILNVIRIAFLAIAATAGCFAAPAASSPATPPPNVVLIISDDHAWTDYSFMGHPHIKTPRLDKLHSESLVFRRGYVPSPLCCPSLASIITGRYPHDHKITSNDPPIPDGMKPGTFQRSEVFRAGREIMNRHLERVATLPRLLSQKGYLSLQTGKWWQGHFSRGGFTHGMTQGQRHGDEGLKIGRNTLQPIYDFIAVAEQEKKPFFIWYAPMLPHTPHNPPDRFLHKYLDKTPSPHIARYWAMVEWFDESCGQLLDHLDERGLADNTLVIYVTDNGWIQDPDSGRFAPRSKQTPYEGGIRTPIMVRWPGRIKPSQPDDLAISLDIVPTVLHLAGIEPPENLPGLNLLDRRAVAGRTTLYGEYFTHNAVDLNNPERNLLGQWVIENQWKLILPRDPSKSAELFQLANDPHEQTNLAAEYPALVQRLTKVAESKLP